MDDAARNTEAAASEEAEQGSSGGGAEIRQFEPKTLPRAETIAKDVPETKPEMPAQVAPGPTPRHRRNRTRRLLFVLLPIAFVVGGSTTSPAGR